MTLFTASRTTGADTSQRPIFFSAPQTGRRIVAGFSYLQRIGKGANTNVWFPDEAKCFLSHPIEWAAVRQFELLQEAGNLSIEDMDVTNFNRTYPSLMKMRGGGYRVTIITLGHYTQRQEADDLMVLDQKIQDEITRLIHFLYLSELSEHACTTTAVQLHQNTWHYMNALPHVAMTLGARHLYKPEKENLKEKTFFELLGLLSNRHIIHDTAVGLVLPDATKEKNWVYIADKGNQLFAFQQAITNVFQVLDKNRAVMTHMRGYGDRLCPEATRWQQQAAQALAA